MGKVDSTSAKTRSEAGKLLGEITSTNKRISSVKNGKKGGRPTEKKEQR